MEIIRHRINTVRGLTELDPRFGAEFDVRSNHRRLILNHELHAEGDTLHDYLDVYAGQRRSGTLIINTKEDGMEEEILRMLGQRRIENFFFLDLTMPATVKLCARQKIKKVAIRVSEYEPLEGALRFQGMADWIWLDCFSGKPADSKTVDELKKHFKICVVSPELEGYPSEKISEFKALKAKADAVCTKHDALWA